MSRLIRVFYCLLRFIIFLFQQIYNETNKVAVRIYLVSEVTCLYPIFVLFQEIGFYAAEEGSFACVPEKNKNGQSDCKVVSHRGRIQRGGGGLGVQTHAPSKITKP